MVPEKLQYPSYAAVPLSPLSPYPSSSTFPTRERKRKIYFLGCRGLTVFRTPSLFHLIISVPLVDGAIEESVAVIPARGGQAETQ